MIRLSIPARRFFGTIAGLLSLTASPVAAQAGAGASQHVPAAAAGWWHDITVLSDDSLRGRATGTEDYLKAARYVADEFKKAGLEPIGTDGYFQTAHLATARLVPEHSGIALVTNGQADTLALGRDATINLTTTTPPDVTGPMVFVGYGLHFPGIRDDIGNTDVRGKVAVYLNRLPSGLSATMIAHSRSGRWEALRAAGAIGCNPACHGAAGRPETGWQALAIGIKAPLCVEPHGYLRAIGVGWPQDSGASALPPEPRGRQGFQPFITRR